MTKRHTGTCVGVSQPATFATNMHRCCFESIFVARSGRGFLPALLCGVSFAKNILKEQSALNVFGYIYVCTCVYK